MEGRQCQSGVSRLYLLSFRCHRNPLPKGRGNATRPNSDWAAVLMLLGRADASQCVSPSLCPLSGRFQLSSPTSRPKQAELYITRVIN